MNLLLWLKTADVGAGLCIPSMGIEWDASGGGTWLVVMGASCPVSVLMIGIGLSSCVIAGEVSVGLA